MIGLDISDQSVKVVQLSNTEPRHFVMRGWYAVQPGLIAQGKVQDAEQAAVMLGKVLERDKVAGGDALVVSIPEAQSFLQVVELPKMTEEEVSEAVRWEVVQHMPFGLENVYIDWQWISAPGNVESDRMHVLVGAAQRDVVDALWDTLSRLGNPVIALELEAQAIVRSLITEEIRNRKGLMIVDVGGHATNVILYDEGAIRFTGTIQKGEDTFFSQLSEQEKSALRKPPGEEKGYDEKAVEAKLMPILNELMVEVLGIEEYYTAQKGSRKVKEILLTGGGSNYPGLDKAITKVFEDVYAQRGNPWVNILTAEAGATLPVKIEESVHYATAVGLALRPAGMWKFSLPKGRWRIAGRKNRAEKVSA